MPVSHGRTLDRVPSAASRSADYPVSALLLSGWQKWVERHLADHENRLKVLEGVVPPTPPGPTPPPPPPPPPGPASTVLWDCPINLDQGKEGECVGFGFSDFLASSPKPNGLDAIAADALAEALYESAQRIEGQPPDEQSGTSVLAGAKAAQKTGSIVAYHWAATINDVIAAIQQLSPVVLGINWTNDMFKPDANGRIRPTGGVAGGHCLIARGYDKSSDLLTLRNSWGAGWGIGGDCTISAPDLKALLADQGEACVPVKV